MSELNDQLAYFVAGAVQHFEFDNNAAWSPDNEVDEVVEIDQKSIDLETELITITMSSGNKVEITTKQRSN